MNASPHHPPQRGSTKKHSTMQKLLDENNSGSDSGGSESGAMAALLQRAQQRKKQRQSPQTPGSMQTHSRHPDVHDGGTSYRSAHQHQYPHSSHQPADNSASNYVRPADPNPAAAYHHRHEFSHEQIIASQWSAAPLNPQVPTLKAPHQSHHATRDSNVAGPVRDDFTAQR